MILTDASVLIHQYRNPTVKRLGLMQTIHPVVCGLTVAEVMAGARTPAQTAGTLALLAFCGRIATPEAVWEAAGRHQASLAVSGLTVPLIDTVIATVALETGRELWAYDQHFVAMAALLPGLKLFREPP